MKPIFTRQLYLAGQEKIDLIKDAEKIMERERWSFNRIVEEALKEYVHRHKGGNVNFQLDTYGKTWTRALSVNKKEEGEGKFHGCKKHGWRDHRPYCALRGLNISYAECLSCR